MSYDFSNPCLDVRRRHHLSLTCCSIMIGDGLFRCFDQQPSIGSTTNSKGILNIACWKTLQKCTSTTLFLDVVERIERSIFLGNNSNATGFQDNTEVPANINLVTRTYAKPTVCAPAYLQSEGVSTNAISIRSKTPGRTRAMSSVSSPFFRFFDDH